MTIEVHVVGGEAVVSRHHRSPDATLAVRAAFDAMHHQLRERLEKLRGPVPGPPVERE